MALPIDTPDLHWFVRRGGPRCGQETQCKLKETGHRETMTHRGFVRLLKHTQAHEFESEPISLVLGPLCRRRRNLIGWHDAVFVSYFDTSHSSVFNLNWRQPRKRRIKLRSLGQKELRRQRHARLQRFVDF